MCVFMGLNQLSIDILPENALKLRDGHHIHSSLARPHAICVRICETAHFIDGGSHVHCYSRSHTFVNHSLKHS